MISEGNCIPMEECVCFVEDMGVVLPVSVYNILYIIEFDS